MTKTAAIVVGAWILSATACSAKDRTSDATDSGAASGGDAGSGGSGATAVGGAAGASTGGSSAVGGSGGTGATGGTGGAQCTAPMAGGKCDTFPQCGCDGGLTCTFTGTITECAAPGGAPPFGACNFSDCPVGYGCYGACKPYCANGSDCVNTGGVCYEAKTGFQVCTRKCALEDATFCGPNLGCVVLNYPQDPAITVTDCVPVGTSTTSCSTGNGCAPGYTCVANQCRKWCRIGFADCAQCGVINPPPFIDEVQYGVCS